MKRRDFIHNTSVLALALPAIFSPGCKPGLTSDPSLTDNEKAADDFPLLEASIEDLQTKMRTGEVTARSLVEMYITRIGKLDRKGVGLNSVIELNPDALSIASQLDQERKDGKVRGALHGIPFMVKDNIDTGDKMMTTAGSLALSGHRAKTDAPLVKQLRDAGAVLLGKTNLSEWANFRSTRSSRWSTGRPRRGCHRPSSGRSRTR